ncbi:hypothetical protein B9Z55_027595 [Caenorhabditis nigoni]|uniref:Uncharacterized protein n=1 Tax=Caenorhabditis nigoni TaxID=1611254 RepID=A0A2G5SFT8_9PELO|nr:hypothetical protein B9Z55_027595 [Caenorhabditis nigoni]
MDLDVGRNDPEMHGQRNFFVRTADNGQRTNIFSTDNGHRTTDKKLFGRTTDTDNGQPKIDGQRTTDSGQRTILFRISEFFP